ncbi:MAG: Na+/H+ antiporter NhaA, partial [Microbacteriaceae bacterium]
MNLLRSDRLAAVYLLVAAILGILLANIAAGDFLLALRDTHLAIPGTPIDLSIGHWVTDGLLVIFFFVASIELKNELVYGDLNSVKKALRPTIAAFGGVMIPAVIYAAVNWGSGFENGWPIPTATDIAFALGVLAVVGKGLPS